MFYYFDQMVSIVAHCPRRWSSIAGGVCRRGSSLLGRATGPAPGRPASVAATAGIR